MKPNSVRYHSPSNIQDLLVLLDDLKNTDGVYIIAGGTDIIPKIKTGLVEPAHLVQLEKLRDLKTIDDKEGKIRIGALSTFKEILDSPLIEEKAPLLRASCNEIGSPQIRARGTIGGNISRASPAGDTLPALYVLDAELELRRLDSTRSVRISDFIKSPDSTTLESGEILTKIVFVPIHPNSKTFFYKLGQRQALCISKVSIAGIVRLEANVVNESRIAYGGVGETIIRARKSEAFLTSRRLDTDTIAEAAQIAATEVAPITDVRSTASYRKQMAQVLLRKALQEMIA